MTKYNILIYPDERLYLPSGKVEKIDDDVRNLIDDMFEVMYKASGGGLAAPQINVHKRVVVIDPSAGKRARYILINPEIIDRSGKFKYEEACLSVPVVSAVVERFNYVKVKALDYAGEEIIIEAEGDYLAVCLQHEIDHLDGCLYIDRISKLKRSRLVKKIKKAQAT